MIKRIILIFIFSIFITNVYPAITDKDHGPGGPEDKKQKGPPPAKKFKLGFNEMKRAIKLEKKGKIKKAKIKYEKALGFLLEANSNNPGNPDILNYLGYIYEKTNDLEYAEIYYRLALEIDPNNNITNGYLGKFYLTTNRKSKALERLKILKNCNCKEYNELKKSIEEKYN